MTAVRVVQRRPVIVPLTTRQIRLRVLPGIAAAQALKEQTTESATEAEASAAAALASEAAAASSAAAALVSETNAETAEGNAETAQAAAEAAQAAAEAARDAALIAETAAELAETNAETAASTATTQAGIATTQAGLAATAKTAAELAETNAETAEVNAEAARAAAEAAAASLDLPIIAPGDAGKTLIVKVTEDGYELDTAAAGLADGDYGDFTVSSGGTVATIDNDAITYAKMQNVSATARVIGRKTALAGDPEELTLTEVLDLVGSAAEGDILYRGASAWARLPKGSALQHLRQNSALTAPEWATGRVALTTNTDFYVRTDGDDGNDGSTNDAGGAFETLQGACDYIKDYIDLNGFTATIRPQKIGGVPTTYDGVALFSEFTGGGSVYIIGDQTTPSDIIIDGGAANCFQLYYGARLFIYGVKLTAATGRGLYAAFNGIIYFDDVDFGDCGTYHIRASGGTIYSGGSYEITGDAAYHWGIHAGGSLYLNGVAITLTGTPAFSSAFCFMESGANIELNGTTFTGSATGKRFLVYGGDMKVTGGVVADTFLPGSIAGTIGAGAHSPGGVFMVRQISGEVKDQLIADDGFFAFKLDDVSAGIVLMTIHTASGAKTAVPVGQFRVRAGGAGAFIENISLDLTKVTLNTAVIPTGTTGTDTFFTISAHANGYVYFENRTGSGRYITLLIM